MFFYNISLCRMWMLSRDDVVTKPRHDIQSKNSCLQSYGIPAASMLSTDSQIIAKMNSAYFVTNIQIPIKKAIFLGGMAPHERRLMIHFDGCSVHTSRVSTDWLEEHGILRMPHSPYSLDLALVTSTCFLQSKKNSNGFSWLTRTSSLSACKEF
jgi:hypothetical protein